ncbi:MAG: PD-(D/E)XK nuclease family protein [Armatimonadetes bacterium]|nr:PD-(D/E)XK nuclease family protein [Armatimonadota bacterium]
MEPLSVSQVQGYLFCSLKYRFQYVDRIPPAWRPAALAFGASVHSAAEWFHRERLAGRSPTPQAAAEVFAADWYAANLAPLVFPERESEAVLAEKGRELIRLYAEGLDGTPPPLLVEDRFEIDLADPETGELLDRRLRGVIDLVEADGTLVELKTAARTFDTGSLERHLQLSTYALVRLLQTGAVPPLRIDALLKTKVPRVDRLPAARSISDLSWTVRLLASVAAAIQAGHFFPNPSYRCAECEYFAQCQAWRGE